MTQSANRSLPGHLIREFVSLLLPVVGIVVAANGAMGDEWPDWRGPSADRHAAGTGYVDSFDPEKGTNVLWTSEE
jgi:hypothetical protein